MAAPGTSDLHIVDGQFDFVKGIFGDRVRAIASPVQPNGIPRDGLAWAVNATMRSGAITQRTGWNPVVQGAAWDTGALFQGAFMLQRDFGDPYIVLAIGGELWRARVDTDNSVDNLSSIFGPGLTMSSTEPQSFFTQGDDLFLVWQDGSLVTNPIFFWDDGATLIGMRRSLGFVAVNDPTNEIPAAGPMDYAQQRIWYALGTRYIAGDIINNQSSGT